jgi:hypothetical protein
VASVADICNTALSHIGSDTVITSISPPDGSVEAGHCARFYPIAREELLESHPWAWSLKRVALATITNPSPVWTYAYALPSDLKSAVRVFDNTTFDALFPNVAFQQFASFDTLYKYTERGSADFVIEGDVLFTHEPDAVLLYTAASLDTTKYSPTFVSALSYLLASYLAGPIIKGLPGAQTSGQLRKIAATVAGEAKSLNSNESAESADHVPEHIRRR